MSYWQIPRAQPQLQEGEIHIWKVELDCADCQWQPLMALLSIDEQIKADRYRFEQHRRRYIMGRTTLRKLLGVYLNRAPEALRFTYNEHGKPSLANDDSRLHFNVSHSGEVMLAAFVLNSGVGIDVETIQQDIDYMAIAQRWFSEQESNTLRNLQVENCIGAFFRVWTRKESYIKALGVGLSYPLNRFSVPIDETSPALLECQDDSQETKSWQIYDIAVSSTYSAAFTIEPARWDIHHYSFDPSLDI